MLLRVRYELKSIKKNSLKKYNIVGVLIRRFLCIKRGKTINKYTQPLDTRTLTSPYTGVCTLEDNKHVNIAKL